LWRLVYRIFGGRGRRLIFARDFRIAAFAFEMFLLIDNYDSFTYNLRHYLGELGAEVEVRRNDALTPAEALAMAPQGIVISPGPCDPDRAGICLDLLSAAAGILPVLGVCLGHQCIGQAFGGRVVRAPKPMHGKVSPIEHRGGGLFAGIPSPLRATRYHSLTVARQGLPECLEVTADSEDGVIQGLSHRELPIHGVQFHPESIASEHGHKLLQNFLDLATGGRIAA
jgi:anthranilate synthase component 2